MEILINFSFVLSVPKLNEQSMADHSRSMKYDLETRQSQRTSVLSLIITWEYVAVS